MVCAQCGTPAPPASTRCAVCDSEIPKVVLADTDVGYAAGADDPTTLAHDAAPADSRSSDGGGTELHPGQKFGTRYTIIRLLGAGGMGAVYQAWDESLGVAVALKLIRIQPTTHPLEVRELESASNGSCGSRGK